ncbi:MAG: YmdB family metallophosphoesterase, partial [Clostridia bacterium]|nr:YmdB family metallophosphoesterase [Clostridia bacterium]
KEFYTMLDENQFLLRPANFPKGDPGRGMGIYDLGRYSVAVINLMGTVYMEPLDNPFDAAQTLVEQAKKEAKFIIVDFHAEATSEKKALGYFLDGRISALFGTHTHVQTSDACVLPQGTGFITDVGMGGPVNSVLGVKPELAIEKMKTKMPVRFETAEGEMMINAVIFELDDKTGLCAGAQSLIIK